LGSKNKVLKCPACNSTYPTIKILESEIVCTECNKHFIKTVEDYFYNFYDGVRDVKGALLSEEKPDFLTNQAFGSVLFRANLSAIKKAILEVNGSTILDIGCGNGRYYYYFKEFVKEYYGLEPSMIPYHRKKNDTEEYSNALFIHYNTENELPIHTTSVDVVTFIASYDHIPDPEPVVKNAWDTLKCGGTMIIVMQNYDFWVKRVLRKVISEKKLKNEDDHFRVHTPETLVKEIYSYVNPIKHSISSDFFFLPNIPKGIGWIYSSKNLISAIDKIISFTLRLFKIRHSGSAMVVSFKKNG
jgi:SAM-dependent methyltransferase